MDFLFFSWKGGIFSLKNGRKGSPTPGRVPEHRPTNRPQYNVNIWSMSSYSVAMHYHDPSLSLPAVLYSWITLPSVRRWTTSWRSALPTWRKVGILTSVVCSQSKHSLGSSSGVHGREEIIQQSRVRTTWPYNLLMSANRLTGYFGRAAMSVAGARPVTQSTSPSRDRPRLPIFKIPTVGFMSMFILIFIVSLVEWIEWMCLVCKSHHV